MLFWLFLLLMLSPFNIQLSARASNKWKQDRLAVALPHLLTPPLRGCTTLALHGTEWHNTRTPKNDPLNLCICSVKRSKTTTYNFCLLARPSNVLCSPRIPVLFFLEFLLFFSRVLVHSARQKWRGWRDDLCHVAFRAVNKPFLFETRRSDSVLLYSLSAGSSLGVDRSPFFLGKRVQGHWNETTMKVVATS